MCRMLFFCHYFSSLFYMFLNFSICETVFDSRKYYKFRVKAIHKNGKVLIVHLWIVFCLWRFIKYDPIESIWNWLRRVCDYRRSWWNSLGHTNIWNLYLYRFGKVTHRAAWMITNRTNVANIALAIIAPERKIGYLVLRMVHLPEFQWCTTQSHGNKIWREKWKTKNEIYSFLHLLQQWRFNRNFIIYIHLWKQTFDIIVCFFFFSLPLMLLIFTRDQF